MRDDLGAGESGLATVIREAWELLGLISFFTAGEGKEGRAWAIPRGTAARAGRRAGSTPTSSAASWPPRWWTGRTWWTPAATPGARERAKLRIEGRDYQLRDGDVMTVRFTP